MSMTGLAWVNIKLGIGIKLIIIKRDRVATYI